MSTPGSGASERKRFIINWSMGIGWIFTGAALMFSAKNVMNTEKWKRTEFVGTQFREFDKSPSVQFINKVFEYDKRTFCFPDSPYLVITQYRVARALTTEPNVTFDNDGVDMRIRDMADDYLLRLGDFYRNYRSGLMSKENISYYLDYYLQRIGGNLDGSTSSTGGLIAFRDSLKQFINVYSYSDVQSLFCLYGLNIVNNDSCRCKEHSTYRKDSIDRKTAWYQ